MKNILLISLFIANSLCSQTISLEKIVDYNIDNGTESLNYVSESSSWKKVYPGSFVYPNNFSNPILVHEIIDYDQVVYQSCNGEIWDKNRIVGYINRWGIDTIGCSRKIINSFINGVIGEYNNVASYIIDENNNFDFSDDKIVPITDSISQPHNVIFERFIENKTSLDTVAIKIISPKKDKDENLKGLNFKYCEYRSGKIYLDNDSIELTLFPGRWYLYHAEPKIVVHCKNDEEQEVSLNQYFQTNRSYYKIAQIDKKGYKLTLNKHFGNDIPFSNQIGYRAPDFKISDSLSLSNLKGKNIFLYFWNIDCGACEYDLPRKYKTITEKKYKNLETILISVADSTRSEKLLRDNKISWLNVKTVGNSPVFNDYGIMGYPNQYLINPNGIILTKGFFINIDEYIE